jgi:phospholipid/cholesterol/gamma-HCH transport system substrate-binding protein
MANRHSDVLLGLVFFAGLIGLGVATIALSDVSFGKPQYDVEIFSADVGYLRPGDPVLLYGMPTGKVRDIERLEAPQTLARLDGTTVECTVMVRARLDADVYSRLTTAGRIIVEDRGLLGGKLVRIDAGPGGEPLRPGAPLVAELAVSALQATGEILEENRADLRRTIDNLAAASDRIGAGQGVLGALVQDDTLADDLRAGVADLRHTAAGLRDVSERVARGEGTLGRLVHDEALHDRVTAFFDDLSSLSEDVRAGEGLLGALVSDEQLADDFRSIVAQVLGTVEDARESSPVQGVGSLLFGTF